MQGLCHNVTKNYPDQSNSTKVRAKPGKHVIGWNIPLTTSITHQIGTLRDEEFTEYDSDSYCKSVF